MTIWYIFYCICSVITLVVILTTEPQYGTYTDNMWIETMTFIPKIQAGATTASKSIWHIYSDVGLTAVQGVPIVYFYLIPT